LRLCLDTSAYSHFKRGHGPAVEAIAHASWVGMPAIVLGELRAGFRVGRRHDENEADLHDFLDEAVVAILDVNEEASSIYAEIVVALRRSGTPLPTNDIWIAAIAAREGVPVLTTDEHFRAIPRIGVHLLRP
jgi:tRNA(fMet)-specific endonuclease VapC